MTRIKYRIGDVFDRLAEIPDGSVDLIVTSPPFLALRSYLPADHEHKHREIGSEPTPAAFLDTLLALSAEWRRVLAPHGSLCVELGDTYSGSGGAGGDYSDGGLREGQQAFSGSAAKRRANGVGDDYRPARSGRDSGWPLAKSLCGIPTLYPWSLAYGRNLLTGEPSPAGQWRIRNLIVWARPNPPVGALGDKFRPATSYITVATTAARRWFDLDAVRTEHSVPPETMSGGGYTIGKGTPKDGNGTRPMLGNPAGAPPLDWHSDLPDGDWLWRLPTQPFSGWSETVRHVRVPADAHADGSQRTTSPDCPVHGSQGHPGSSALDGAREAGSTNRTARTGTGPARAPGDGSLPTLWSSGQTDGTDGQDDRAATPHSTPSRRTDLAPATSPAGMPSARTSRRTGGTSGEPESSELHPGTPESNSESGDSPANPEQGTSARTADTASDDLIPCTCSFYVVKSITERSSHYATFPLELPRRLILAMCPPKVCRTCGRPSERVVEAVTLDAYRQSDRPQTRRAVEMADAAGLTDAHVQAVMARGISESGKAAVLSNGNGKNSAEVQRLANEAKAVLGGYVREFTQTTTASLGSTWTDCGHDDWRTGVVLDPFAGSGTTGEAALAVGRDCILIDLDARNADLARDRCGLFLEVSP